MTRYNRITHIENNRRIAVLNRFGEQYSRYLKGADTRRSFDGPNDTKEASEARSEINRMLDEVTEILVAAGVPPVLQWSPPPAIGGRGCNLNVIMNIFRLRDYMVAPREVFDFIERAGGIYEQQHRAAVIRTFNPFFWIGRVFSWVAGLPFRFLAHLGFRVTAIEANPIGKAFKGLVELATGIAAIVGALKLFDGLDPVLEFLHLAPK